MAAVGLPAVFVPLPIGNGEQARNAAPVVSAGGALLVDDAALNADWLRDQVVALAGDPARLAAMSTAAAGLMPRDGDTRLAEMILAAVRR
ncbi:hypothetical protein BH20ACT6_BH20ACT6_18150 [soil metagenome]